MTDRNMSESFPGYPNLRRFVESDRYGLMELLSVEVTSDGFLTGFARLHVGTDSEYCHSIFIGRAQS